HHARLRAVSIRPDLDVELEVTHLHSLQQGLRTLISFRPQNSIRYRPGSSKGLPTRGRKPVETIGERSQPKGGLAEENEREGNGSRKRHDGAAIMEANTRSVHVLA